MGKEVDKERRECNEKKMVIYIALDRIVDKTSRIFTKRLRDTTVSMSNIA